MILYKNKDVLRIAERPSFVIVDQAAKAARCRLKILQSSIFCIREES